MGNRILIFFQKLYNVLLSFAMINPVSNPLLYAWLNPTFRELLVKTFFKKRAKLEKQR